MFRNFCKTLKKKKKTILNDENRVFRLPKPMRVTYFRFFVFVYVCSETLFDDNVERVSPHYCVENEK